MNRFMREADGVRIEQVTDPVTLGEGPHWDSNQLCLYFVSIFDYSIHKYVAATGMHTYTKLEAMPSFIIPVSDTTDEFVVSQGRSCVVVRWNGEQHAKATVIKKIVTVDDNRPDNRFNDAKADPEGRLFAGTMGHEYAPGKFLQKQGSLYKVCADRAVPLADNIDISNGLCWDEKRDLFYFIDSFEYDVRRYRYDRCTGQISAPENIFPFAANGIGGIPDGMTIDSDGKLWIANFDGSQVLQLDPETSKVLRRVAIPALQVTSVAWGGRDFDELYVTTACMNRGVEQLPPAGALFRVTGLRARGLPMQNVRL